MCRIEQAIKPDWDKFISIQSDVISFTHNATDDFVFSVLKHFFCCSSSIILLDYSSMKHLLKFTRILLVLLMIVCSTQATTRQTFYDMVEPGQSIRGTLLKEFKTQYKIQCSDKSV